MERVGPKTFAWLAALLLAACASAQAPIEEGYVPVRDGVELYFRTYGAGAPDLIVTNHVVGAYLDDLP